jgi:hypothetical protein
MMTRRQAWAYGTVCIFLGAFSMFPYFLPDGMLRSHLHEYAPAVGLIGASEFILGGYMIGIGRWFK